MKKALFFITAFLSHAVLAHEGHPSYGSLFHELEHTVWLVLGLVSLVAAYCLRKITAKKLNQNPQNFPNSRARCSRERT